MSEAKLADDAAGAAAGVFVEVANEEDAADGASAAVVDADIWGSRHS